MAKDTPAPMPTRTPPSGRKAPARKAAPAKARSVRQGDTPASLTLAALEQDRISRATTRAVARQAEAMKDAAKTAAPEDLKALVAGASPVELTALRLWLADTAPHGKTTSDPDTELSPG